MMSKTADNIAACVAALSSGENSAVIRILFLALVEYRDVRMAGSHWAVITAPAGSDDSANDAIAATKDYGIVLPSLPSGEAMKRKVILHCDMAGQPYRIEDFRQPLKYVGVTQDVRTIGAYQMSHVWLLNMGTEEAKNKLLEVGQLVIKEKMLGVCE